MREVPMSKKIEVPKEPKEPKYDLTQLKPFFTGVEYDFLQVYVNDPVTIKEAQVILKNRLKGAVY